MGKTVGNAPATFFSRGLHQVRGWTSASVPVDEGGKKCGTSRQKVPLFTRESSDVLTGKFRCFRPSCCHFMFGLMRFGGLLGDKM